MACGATGRQFCRCGGLWRLWMGMLAEVEISAMTERQPLEIVPEAIAKRRLAIYTAVRLAGLVALAGGVLKVADGIGVVGLVLVVVGAASLFMRPRLLAAVFGSRW